MPGCGETNGTLDALRSLKTNERVSCIPLHGELELQEQDRAFAPNALRKIIVATNVAETSITIAAAHRAGTFELPLMDHRLKQFIARVNLHPRGQTPRHQHRLAALPRPGMAQTPRYCGEEIPRTCLEVGLISLTLVLEHGSLIFYRLFEYDILSP
jgi:Helicase conserved C-terminal domain